MELTTILAVLFSILVPAKSWYAPGEPLLVKIDSASPVSLVLTESSGTKVQTDAPTLAQPGQSVDVRAMFPAMRVGTYLLYAIPQGQTTREFVGTPLVIQLRGDARPGAPAGAICIKVEPLCYAAIDTTAGAMTLAFYYDVAPNTVANFISLSRGGFYDGLMFHRVVPGFVIQAGDPLGDSSGGPGYSLGAEFNGKPHVAGVISMAREGDPLESQGMMPRPEFANSAGSQFFLCLDYAKTKRLDNKYTAFGKLTAGIENMQKVGQSEIADTSTGRPKSPTTIKSITIRPVTATDDPYLILQSGN